MPTKALAVLSLVLLLSGTTLFLYSENRQAAHRLTAEEIERERLVDRVTELEGELRAIRMRLTEERNAAAQSAFQAQQALEHGARVESAASEVSHQRDRNSAPRAILIQSPDEADDAARELMARHDPRGMLFLLEDLLAMGEPGFETLCKLAAELDLVDTIREGDKMLMGPEMYRFLHDGSEALLRLGLFLDSQQTVSIPDGLRGEFLLSDQELPLLLGFYSGDDPEILQGYTRKLRVRADEDAASAGKIQDCTLRGLAQIPTEGAVDALVDLLPRVSGEHRPALLWALAWQGSPRALPALQLLREGTTDVNQRNLIDETIQRLK